MKRAILSDTHFGCRSDSRVFIEYFRQFYETIFFPYLLKNNITEIIHPGDLMDRRKFCNFYTLQCVRDMLIDPMRKHGMTMKVILGNHDTYYKNTNDVNSVKCLFQDSKDVIQWYESATTIKLDGVDVCVVPWICSDNMKESFEEINRTTADICIGHLELTGYQHIRGHSFVGGTDPALFDKFKMVLSGHFHYRQTRGNIHYLGTPYEMMWNDYEVPKGFHVFDPITSDLEFIENPYKMFHRLVYNDKENNYDQFVVDSSLTGKYLKVIVAAKTKPFMFDRFIDTLYSVDPGKVTVVEDMTAYDTVENETMDESQDTVSLLGSYIDQLEISEDKQRLKTIMQELYVESLNVE